MAFALPLAFSLAGGGLGFGVGSALGLSAGALSFATSVGFLAGTLLFSATLGRKTGNKQRAVAADFQIPLVTEGVPLPVIYGTQRTSGFVGTWSNFKSKTIKHSSGGGSGGLLGGGGSSLKEIRYFIDYQYCLCMGPVQKLRSIDINKKKIAEPNLDWSVSPATVTTDFGDITFYWGTEGQDLSPYMAAQDPDTETPRFNRICYWTAEKWKLGNAPNLQSVTATVSRYPFTGLGGSIDQPINDFDANPAGVIFEILTNTYFGLRIPHNWIDLESFKNAAQVFADEGTGVSFTMDRSQAAASVIEDLKLWTNSYLVLNPLGQISIKTLREDTDIANSNNVIRIDDNSMLPGTLETSYGSWADVPNLLKIEYSDGANDFIPRSFFVFNEANLQATQTHRSESINLSGLSNADAATRAGNRILAQRGYPLAKATFECNRTTTRPWIGRHILLVPSTWRTEDQLVMVITGVEESVQDRDTVTVTCIEDALSKINDVSFGVPPDTDPHTSTPLSPFTRVRAYELPSGLNPNYLSGEVRVIVAAGQDPDPICSGYQVYARVSGSGDDYQFQGGRDALVPAGGLITSLTNTGSVEDALAIVEVFLDGYNDDQTGTVSTTQWQQDYQLMLVGDELISVKEVEPITVVGYDNAYRLTGLRRAVLGSTSGAHSAGDNVYFVRPIIEDYFAGTALRSGESYEIKVQPVSPSRAVDLADITQFSLSL